MAVETINLARIKSILKVVVATIAIWIIGWDISNYIGPLSFIPVVMFMWGLLFFVRASLVLRTIQLEEVYNQKLPPKYWWDERKKALLMTVVSGLICLLIFINH